MDVSEAFLDPELGCTSFQIERITYISGRTGTTKTSSVVQALGSIHPGTPEMIQLLPEEDRGKVFISVYTNTEMSTGTANENSNRYRGADRITWNSKTWRVVKTRNWINFGLYQAMAVEMNEEDVN